jgi:hypothetical protein
VAARRVAGSARSLQVHTAAELAAPNIRQLSHINWCYPSNILLYPLIIGLFLPVSLNSPGNYSIIIHYIPLLLALLCGHSQPDFGEMTEVAPSMTQKGQL